MVIDGKNDILPRNNSQEEFDTGEALAVLKNQIKKENIDNASKLNKKTETATELSDLKNIILNKDKIKDKDYEDNIENKLEQIYENKQTSPQSVKSNKSDTIANNNTKYIGINGASDVSNQGRKQTLKQLDETFQKAPRRLSRMYNRANS